MPKNTNYNLSNKPKKTVSRKRKIIFIILGLVLLLAVLLVLDRRGTINLPFLPDKNTPSQPSSGDINYGPPTEQEKTETQEFKENLGEESKPSTTPSTPSTSPSSKKSVTPIMTSWDPKTSGDVVVSGYVPGITEEGGTCTLTLTKGSQKVTEPKAATPNAQTVSCGQITIARNRLSAGNWSATLSYSSNSSEGVSTANTIEVQ